MKLLGITGKKRSGKDTAANILCVECNYDKFSFATILKAMTATCLARLGIDQETRDRMIDGDLKEMPVQQLCGRTTRHAMQTIGTEWGRNCIDQDFWVRACIREAQSVSKAVISDVRFPNEAQAIRDAGGKVIRILRDGCNGDGHFSEVMDFSADFTVENNGSIEELRTKLREYDFAN